MKSVALRQNTSQTFATGARDGHIFLWDARSSSSEPLERLRNVHSYYPKKPSSRRRRRLPEDSQHSITSVTFMKDDYTLLSSGSVDGMVKLWDTRKLYYRKRPCPVREIRPSNETRRVGITSMCLDSTNTRLLVSYYRTGKIRLFDLSASPSNALICVFSGHKNDSFYVKSSFSPDERFVVSGSCDCGIYIWNLERNSSERRRGSTVLPLQNPLRGHTQEVTCVDWRIGTAGDELVSCSDDGSVRIWTNFTDDDNNGSSS